MKKSILNIGKVLKKDEQKNIFGGSEDVPHIELFLDEPNSYGDNSPEECALPFVIEGDRCVHICASSQKDFHTWCN